MRYCLNNHLPNGKAALQSSVKKRDEQRFCRNHQKGLALFVQSAIITASQNTNGTKGSRTCKSTAAPFRYAQRRAAHHRAVRLLFCMNIRKRGHTMKKRNRVLALTVSQSIPTLTAKSSGPRHWDPTARSFPRQSKIQSHWGGGKGPRPLRLGKGNGADDFLTVFSKPDKRLKPGRNLCADCLGLHNGLRHYPHDQLRPR